MWRNLAVERPYHLLYSGLDILVRSDVGLAGLTRRWNNLDVTRLEIEFAIWHTNSCSVDDRLCNRFVCIPANLAFAGFCPTARFRVAQTRRSIQQSHAENESESMLSCLGLISIRSIPIVEFTSSWKLGR